MKRFLFNFPVLTSPVVLLTMLLLLISSALALEQTENGGAGIGSHRAHSTPDELEVEQSNQSVLFEETVSRLLAGTNGRTQVSLNPATGAASFIRLPADTLSLNVQDSSPAAKAWSFFNEFGDVFGITDAGAQLNLVETRTDYLGATHLTFQQIHQGVEVFAGVLKVHLDADSHITAVNGTFIPDLTFNTIPAWTMETLAPIAVETVLSQARVQGTAVNTIADISARPGRLLIFRTGLVRGVPGQNHLVYEFEVTNPALTIREFVYLDAQTGKIVDQITGIHTGLDRKVSENNLDNVIWQDSAGDPDPIPAGWAGGSAQQVIDWQNEIDGAQETYNLFSSMTNGAYLSYDGLDATMRTVNNAQGIPCPNATWNGISTNYCSDVTGDDTVAHEWGHAYTQYTNDLIYQWQSGALNESYSDIWGEVVDFLNGRGIDTPDIGRPTGACSSNLAGANFPGNPTVNTVRWLSGEDDGAFFDIPTGSGNAIRDMWNPTCFGDPGKVTDTNRYVCEGWIDNGGVHINSGVPNHAFALMVDGGSYNGQTITGIGLTKSAHIHWQAQNMLTPASNFLDHADALEAACSSLTGVNLNALDTASPVGVPSGQIITTNDCQEVAAAIAAVELRTPPAQCNFTTLLDPDAPPLCSPGESISTISLQDWESGLGSWTAGTRDVANPATFSTPDWAAVDTLPGGAPDGSTRAAFVADLIEAGDCLSDDETGVLYLQSPAIAIPGGATTPQMAFDHWMASEFGWDGGNLKISVNGGPFTLLPGSAFTFNAYNQNLNIIFNTNPLAGEVAFTGADGGSVGGSWGQSQIDLNGIAGPGDTIELRYEFGLDGCNGLIGWFVDNVHVYACSAIGENTAPILTGLPDQMLNRNQSIDNAIDLWAYTSDNEDVDADLTFTISNTPVISAGVTIDANRYIDINPGVDWTGTTSVTVQVEDKGALTDMDTFLVTVLDSHLVYLPIMMKPQP